MSSRLYYFHDPMCSWCWGYRPTFKKLLSKLPEDISVEYVLGGLAPDNDQVMPAEMRETIEGYWRKIQRLLGTEFNFAFWQQCQPRRDTYKACRAVIAAREEGLDLAMLEAVQQAYYLRAINPAEIDTLVRLAGEIGMEEEGFRIRLFAEETDRQLQQEINLTRQWQVQGFPALILQVNQQRCPVPVDYQDEEATLQLLRDLHQQGH